jgi:hypothetical protein
MKPLDAALDDLAARQEKIEQTLYRRSLARRGTPPTLFLYDVSSSYLEGEHNALGAFGYNRDGKRGTLQIVIGLLADRDGDPLAVRVFAGNTGDPATVVEQITIIKQQFGADELVFVENRGMVKTTGKRALNDAGLRYITALVDLRLEDGAIVVTRQEGPLERALDLAGCCAVVTDVAAARMSDQAVHDTYVSVPRVERDFRQMNTGLLDVRPVFVRNESRTRGHVSAMALLASDAIPAVGRTNPFHVMVGRRSRRVGEVTIGAAVLLRERWRRRGKQQGQCRTEQGGEALHRFSLSLNMRKARPTQPEAQAGSARTVSDCTND